MKKTVSLLSTVAIASTLFSSFAFTAEATVTKPTFSLEFAGYTTAGSTTISYFPQIDVWIELPFELTPYSCIEPDWETTFDYEYAGKMVQTMGCDVDLADGTSTYVPSKSIANTEEVAKCKISKNASTGKIQLLADAGSSSYDEYYAGASKVKLGSVVYRTTDPDATNSVTITTGTVTVTDIDNLTGNATPTIYAMSSGKIDVGEALVVPSYNVWSKPAEVPVESVTLDKSTLALDVYNNVTATLKATVTPADATDNTVTWSTSAADVATVDNGVVTAVAKGTATITATAGGKNATCEVTVTDSTPVTPTYPAVGTKIAVGADSKDIYYAGYAESTEEKPLNANTTFEVKNGEDSKMIKSTLGEILGLEGTGTIVGKLHFGVKVMSGSGIDPTQFKIIVH